MPDQRIEDITFADLQRFPLGGGIGIPTLRETLAAVGGRAIAFIEIKAVNIEALVVRVIRESQADCAVHSFDHRIVRTVRKIFPAIRTGVLQVARLIDPVAPLLQAGAQDLWQHVDYIDEDLVTAAQSAGARVIAWTANDPTRWKELASLGIDGVCSDRIGELAAANIQLR